MTTRAVRGRATGATPRGPAPPAAPLPRAAAVFTVFAFASALAWLVTHQLADPDLWQHLTVGRAMWESKSIPHQHLWTYPSFGQTEVLPSWLFRAVLWPFQAAAGVWGLQAWRWWTTLAAFGLLALAARRLGVRGVAPWLSLVLCALVYRQRSQVRPETLVAVLLAAQLWLLERSRAGDRRALLGVPLVALLWANAHISWWMGLAITALFTLEAWRRERALPRDLLLVGAASVALSFVNPFGWHTLAQPFEYQFQLRDDPLYRTIAELKPVDWADNLWNGLPLLVAGWPLLALARWRRRGFDVVEAGLLLLFLPLGLMTQRFVGFLALVAAPYLARDVAHALEGARLPALPPWPRALAPSLVAFALVVVERSHAGLASGPGVDTRFLPVAACDYMERAGVRGHGLNEFWQGGYLLWRFWPQRDRLPFMDIHQSGSRENRALVAELGRGPGALQALDREHRFEWVLCSNQAQLSGELANVLDADSTWALAFYDDASLLYLRRPGSITYDSAAREGYRFLRGGSTGLRRLGELVSADPTLRPAVRAELERAVRESPARSGLAHNLLANVAMIDGDWPRAVAHLDSAIATGVVIDGLRERRARAALGAASGR